MVRDQEVDGSSPFAPAIFLRHNQESRSLWLRLFRRTFFHCDQYRRGQTHSVKVFRTSTRDEKRIRQLIVKKESLRFKIIEVDDLKGFQNKNCWYFLLRSQSHVAETRIMRTKSLPSWVVSAQCDGGNQEYVLAPVEALARMPESLDASHALTLRRDYYRGFHPLRSLLTVCLSLTFSNRLPAETEVVVRRQFAAAIKKFRKVRRKYHTRTH
jgi:hypothetical protein